jgi:hypothetical protein
MQSAWSWLPVSAVIEMTAVTVFALNLFVTFVKKPPFPAILSRNGGNLAAAMD